MKAPAHRPAGGLTPDGFTLVELLVTLAILAILAAVAVGQMSGWTAAEEARKFAREVQSQINAARRRAINAGAAYEVHLTQTSVQWLRKAAGVIVERGPLVQAPAIQANQTGSRPLGINGVLTSNTAALSNTRTYLGTQSAPSVVFDASTDWVMSIDPAGVIDGDVTNNGISPAPIDGVTIFIDGPRPMRLVVYPLAAQAIILDNW